MNQDAQIIPPNSPLGRPGNERRSSVRVVVFVVLALNLVLLIGLLIQGCKHSKPSHDTTNVKATNALLRPISYPPVVAAPTAETNPPPPAAQLSPPVVMEPSVPSSSTKPYSVVKGDSFYKIAHANSISMSALISANPGVDSAKLKVGRVLQVPPTAGPASASGPSTATPVTIDATANHSPNFHVVKSGDTLAKIAGVQTTTVKALRAANGLRTDTLVVGQKLKLPEPGVATAANARNSSSQL